MGVTIIKCTVQGCPILLNGEICHFEKGAPLCNRHVQEIDDLADAISSEIDKLPSINGIQYPWLREEQENDTY